MTDKNYKYIDREKSWLAFNARVLQEAGGVLVSAWLALVEFGLVGVLAGVWVGHQRGLQCWSDLVWLACIRALASSLISLATPVCSLFFKPVTT